MKMVKDLKTDKLLRDLSAAGLSGKFGKPGELVNVRVWVRDRFQCVYCGEDLLKDRIRMTSAQVDHLLPRSKYSDYVDLMANRVLACFCCNQIKRNFDPLEKLGDEVRNKISPVTLDDFRPLLLEKCQEYLRPRLKKKDDILEKSVSILRKEYKQV